MCLKYIVLSSSVSSYYEKMADGTVRCIDSEIPFAIPDSWAWARFGGIAFNRDSERIPLSVSQRNGLEKKYDYYGASGIIDKVDRYLFDKPLLLIGEDGANLINRSTPIAFIARGKYWVNNHAHVLDFISPILMEYVGNYVNGISLVDYVTGTAQPKMNQEKMNSILVPIPSLTEQSRINDRIANLLPIISKYDNQKDALEKLNNSLNQEIKKSILQEAIQGRLVPQIESEGTAEELLEEIEAEKKRLVKEGKLKKSALTASRIFRGDDNRYYEQIASQVLDITEEIPFTIPSSWQWCRLNNILIINPKNEAPDCIEAAFVPMEKMSAGFGSGYSYEMRKWSKIKKGFSHFADGDIAFAKIAPCFQNRKGTVFENLPNRIGAGSTELKVLRVVGETINPNFVLCFLQSPYFIDEAKFKGTANQQRIVSGYLESKLFPLPPLSEQKRIVIQLENLFERIK